VANRKQQKDKEVKESVQRVAEATAKPKEPANPASKAILNRKVRMGMAAPLHPRAAADRATRLAELSAAAEEARMQGEKARKAEKQQSNKVREDKSGLGGVSTPGGTPLPNQPTEYKTTPLKGVGGYVSKNKAGKTLKSSGDYSTWKPKRSGKNK
jgi:hypothetical protein